MFYVLIFVFGVITGLFCVVPGFLLVRERRQALDQERRDYDTKASEARQDLKAREHMLTARLAEASGRFSDLDRRETAVTADRADLDARIISYRELQDENTILKRDLQNIDVNVNKLQLDQELQQKRQNALDERSMEVGSRYLKDTVKWIGQSLNASNFTLCKQRLLDVIERLREIGFPISSEEEARLVSDLKSGFEEAVRAAFAREEQARIKAQIREEEKLRREVDREITQAQREQAAIQAALTEALAKAKDQHSAEIEQLKSKLATAEERAQRAISQAQLTKAGHVYIISNLGTLGEGVFKIGMTRRLEPKERVHELGDASVPFPFDVHMMISSNDAPALENALHRALHTSRLNKVNPRKEFFRTELATICKIVAEHHGEVQYVADPEAFEYRQSLSMSETDAEYIETVYNKLEDDGDEATAEA